MNSMHASEKHGVTVLSIPPAFFQLYVQIYGQIILTQKHCGLSFWAETR